ncbi:hypothetical protein BHM03_00009097 [Ensete ventricosum]|nr:hypothetical protein BHM03_00009097 [Ensete ventricosum]
MSGPVWGFRLDWSAHPIDNASPYLSEEESVLVNRMDLGELRGMPKVTNDKGPPTRAATQEVGSSPAREAPKASSKRPVDVPIEQATDAAKRYKKIKVLMRRHKSRLDEVGSHS